MINAIKTQGSAIKIKIDVFMFGQVNFWSGQVDFPATCMTGQVVFKVNVEPCNSDRETLSGMLPSDLRELLWVGSFLQIWESNSELKFAFRSQRVILSGKLPTDSRQKVWCKDDFKWTATLVRLLKVTLSPKLPLDPKEKVSSVKVNSDLKD